MGDMDESLFGGLAAGKVPIRLTVQKLSSSMSQIVVGPHMPTWLHDLYIWVQEMKGAWPEILGATVGSFLGLVALVLGALYNARLNRMAERQKDLDDKFGVTDALLAEISSIGVALQKNSDELNQEFEDNTKALMPDPARHTGIFEKFLSRIELFDEATITHVCELYTVLDQYCGTVVAIGGGFDQSIKGRGTLVINGTVAPRVIVLNRGLVRRCDTVISHLRAQRLFNAHRISRT